MTQKVVVVILHGVGNYQRNKEDKRIWLIRQFSKLRRKLSRKKCKDEEGDMEILACGIKEALKNKAVDVKNDFQFECVYWDEESRLGEHEEQLKEDMKSKGMETKIWFTLPLYMIIRPIKSFNGWLREFIFDRLGDVAAYQPTSEMQEESKDSYARVHKVLVDTFHKLAHPDAPEHLKRDAKDWKDARLCIISHSLGSIVASNYVYDMQADETEPNLIVPKLVKKVKENGTTLEKMETLDLFITMGSPLALWSLRYGKGMLDKPITVCKG